MKLFSPFVFCCFFASFVLLNKTVIVFEYVFQRQGSAVKWWQLDNTSQIIQVSQKPPGLRCSLNPFADKTEAVKTMLLQ